MEVESEPNGEKEKSALKELEKGFESWKSKNLKEPGEKVTVKNITSTSEGVIFLVFVTVDRPVSVEGFPENWEIEVKPNWEIEVKPLSRLVVPFRITV